MEFLGFLIIGFVIAIFVLPFVALAKTNKAKRGVDDLVKRLSSLENELRNLRPKTVVAVTPETPVAAPLSNMEAVSPTLPIVTPAPVAPQTAPLPPPIPRKLSSRPFLRSRDQANRQLIGSNSWALNCSRGSADWRFSWGGIFREVFVRAQPYPAGVASGDRIHRRHQPCHWRFASKTKRKLPSLRKRSAQPAFWCSTR